MQEPRPRSGLARDSTYTCGQIVELLEKQMRTDAADISRACRKAAPKKVDFGRDWEAAMRRAFPEEHTDLLPQLLENQWLFRFPDDQFKHNYSYSLDYLYCSTVAINPDR